MYHDTNCVDTDILSAIDKAVNASIELRSKKELIESFVERMNVTKSIDDWQHFVQERKEDDLTALITEENLKPEEARRFIDMAFRDGILKTTGTDIDKILPPVSRFGQSAGGQIDNRTRIKQRIIENLMAFFEKYCGLV